MKKFLALAAGVCVTAALAAAQVAQADTTASIVPSWSATDVATCSGSTTVHVHIDATDPAAVLKPVDVAFVIDESGSIAAGDFNTVKNSLLNWASPQVFGPSNVGAGVVEFSGDARIAFPIQYVKQSFLNGVTSMYQRGGSTNLTAGLSMARNMLGAYGRPNVPDVYIVETDGLSNVDTATLLPTAAAIKGTGALIYGIGVGAFDSTQLGQVVTQPAAQYMFAPGGYAALNTAFQQIITQLNPAATNLTYSATAAPGWTITGANVTHTASSVSFFASPVHTGPIDITYTMQHTGATGGALAPQATADLHWTDNAGVAQAVSYAASTVQVDGCNQPPAANAGPDQSVTLSGSPLANVTLDGTGSTDDGQIAPLTYSWSENGTEVATGATPTIQLGAGTHHITLTVDDGQYQDTDDVDVVVADLTPPVIVPTVTGTLGSNGWYVSNVAVSWSVTDAESAIGSSSGCGPSTLSADAPGTTYTCTAASDGGSSSVTTASIKRDATGPTVTYSGNAGTYGVADTIHITCAASDNLSGVASTTCSDIDGPAYLFGGTHTYSASATDNAGNTGGGSTSFTVVVRAADVCALVGQWVDRHGIANALCAKVGHGTVNAFINQVNAQRGKSMTSAQADVLIDLIRQL